MFGFQIRAALKSIVELRNYLLQMIVFCASTAKKSSLLIVNFDFLHGYKSIAVVALLTPC